MISQIKKQAETYKLFKEMMYIIPESNSMWDIEIKMWDKVEDDISDIRYALQDEIDKSVWRNWQTHQT